MNIRATPDNSSHITSTPQYAEENHFNAVSGELVVLMMLLVFIFRMVIPLLARD